MNHYIQYTKPIKNDICVVFAFFNPCGYVRPLQNLLFFENKLKIANIPYFSAEMIIANQSPMLANPTCVYRSNSYLFYKEELFNKLETLIPEQYTKMIFLDCDIIFDCANWVDKISVLLDTHDILQVFERVCYLDLTYKQNYWMNGSAVDLNVAGSGFGWAMTRSFFAKIGGFFDKCTLGSGDSIFFHSIVNRPVMKYPVIQGFITEYREKIAKFKPKYTYLAGVNIYHLSHGSKVNRRYADRYGILTRSDFTWDSLFYKNADGFWELSDSKINTEFLEYFKNRNEDSICAFTTVAESRAIGAVPPSRIPVSKGNKGHSGGNGSFSNVTHKITDKPVLQKPITYMPVIRQHENKPVRNVNLPTPKAAQVPHNGPAKVIPRYLVPAVPLQMRSHASSPSQAAAIKSMEQRQNIRNTVVYNRVAATPQRNYDEDDDYSD